MIQTPFSNPHALAVAAVLRHTVANPGAPTMPLPYHAWQRINRVLWAKPISITKSEVAPLVEDFAALLAAISAEAHMAVTTDDLDWLVGVISDRDATTLAMLMVMCVTTPQDDMISLEEAARMLGHKSTSTLRTWIGQGRFYSAKKPGGRDWLLARSELAHRTDI